MAAIVGTRRTSSSDQRRASRGQALVETALILPIILILLLGAIDFGRLFFSWVTLHQAARIGANFAAIDSSTTPADIPDIVADEYAGLNCDADEPDAPLVAYTRAGAPVTDPELGDYAKVTLTCRFHLLTPLSDQLFGGPLTMRATSSFPVRTGCIGCGSGGSAPPPPPPPEQCRTVPSMAGMSVGGARLAWQSAGFVGAFNTTGTDTQTVAPGPVIDPLDAACMSPLAIFNAQVTVTIVPPETTPAGCEVLPNLVGITIDNARTTWDGTAFTGDLLPPGPDADPNAVVTSQTLLQDGSPVTAEPGVTCLDPATVPAYDVEVGVGPAWPNPPPAPCQVPHLIDKNLTDGQTEWGEAGFTGSFSPTSGNWKIKSQSLVGFSWVPCETPIVVSQRP
jgi:TadE-like protein